MLQDLATLAGAKDPQLLAENLMVLVVGSLVVRHIMGINHADHIARRNAEMFLKQHLPGKKPARWTRQRAVTKREVVLSR
jgi:hypothetical protein